MRKALSLILILALFCSSTFGYVLAEEKLTRSSNYFTSYGTSMSNAGNGGVAITFKAVGTTVCNQIGVAGYHVERLDDDGNWENVSGALSGQTGANVAVYTFGRYFQGVAGETYRIQVTFVSAIGTGMEHKSYTSGKITAE